jgi:hypothetical protein
MNYACIFLQACEMGNRLEVESADDDAQSFVASQPLSQLPEELASCFVSIWKPRGRVCVLKRIDSRGYDA